MTTSNNTATKNTPVNNESSDSTTNLDKIRHARDAEGKKLQDVYTFGNGSFDSILNSLMAHRNHSDLVGETKKLLKAVAEFAAEERLDALKALRENFMVGDVVTFPHTTTTTIKEGDEEIEVEETHQWRGRVIGRGRQTLNVMVRGAAEDEDEIHTIAITEHVQIVKAVPRPEKKEENKETTNGKKRGRKSKKELEALAAAEAAAKADLKNREENEYSLEDSDEESSEHGSEFEGDADDSAPVRVTSKDASVNAQLAKITPG